MKVIASICSYASGAVSYEETFPSIKAAVDHFRRRVNGTDDGLPMDGYGDDGKPDATILVYSVDNRDNPVAMFSVSRRLFGQWTLRRNKV